MITLSMSALQSYLRCRKKFELRYIRGIEDNKQKREALEKGSLIHKYFEYYMKRRAKIKCDEVDETTEESKLVQTYLNYKGYIEGEYISIEDPIYWQFSDNVRIRGTIDLLVKKDSHYTIVDWKSFSRMPSLDSDLDFQARTYCALISMVYPEAFTVEFRHEYVRTTLPLVPKDKAGNSWRYDECYISHPTIYSRKEIEEDVRELEHLVTEILQNLDGGLKTRSSAFRTHLKGGGYDSCDFCPVKEACKEEKHYGVINLNDYVKVDNIYA